eukprot:COSAG02_NODE_3948_length_6001_cov_23.394844_2_plen_108_part_00
MAKLSNTHTISEIESGSRRAPFVWHPAIIMDVSSTSGTPEAPVPRHAAWARSIRGRPTAGGAPGGDARSESASHRTHVPLARARLARARLPSAHTYHGCIVVSGRAT